MAIGEIFSSFNIALISLIIGAIVFFVWYGTSKNKKDKRNTLRWVWVIAIGVFAIGAFADVGFLTDAIDFGGGTLAVSSTSPVSLDGKTICAVEDTTVTLAAKDAYNATASGGTHRYRINGNPALTVSDAGTFTASPGDSVEILWENAASGVYFGDVSTHVVPCSGTSTFTKDLYSNGTVTMTVYNEDNNAIASGAAEAVAAGDVVTLDATIKGTFEKGFPFGGIIVAEWSKTYFDDVIVDFGGAEVSSPNFYTLTNATYTSKAYTIPAFLSTTKLEGLVTIDADDTNEPAGENSGNITLTYYANDFFINEEAGGSFDGPSIEDEDDSQTGPQATAFTLRTS